MDTRKDFLALINTIAEKHNPLGKDALVAITEKKDAKDLWDWVVNIAKFTDISLEECQRLIDNRENLKQAGMTMTDAIRNSGY
jgi:hypothetical protein